MGVRLSATATVKGKDHIAEVTPAALEFETVGQALDAAANWAKDGFVPVIGTFKKLEITIDAT